MMAPSTKQRPKSAGHIRTEKMMQTYSANNTLQQTVERQRPKSAGVSRTTNEGVSKRPGCVVSPGWVNKVSIRYSSCNLVVVGG